MISRPLLLPVMFNNYVTFNDYVTPNNYVTFFVMSFCNVMNLRVNRTITKYH